MATNRLTPDEIRALLDIADHNDPSRANDLWPSFMGPGGYVLVLAVEQIIASRLTGGSNGDA